jgi:hypothetical protein
MEDM